MTTLEKPLNANDYGIVPLMWTLQNQQSLEYDRGANAIKFDGALYDNTKLFKLITDCPQLMNEALALTEIVHFFFFHDTHRLIREAKSFVATEKLPYAGDVSLITDPRIHDGKLIFFQVEHHPSPGTIPQISVVIVPFVYKKFVSVSLEQYPHCESYTPLPQPKDKNCILM